MRALPLIVVLLAGAVAVAEEPAPRTRVANCTTAGCHASQMNHEVLHGPTAVSACDACHDYVDPAEHTFKLRREGRDLCIFCHIDQSGTEGAFVHAPMGEGKCTACHDPHGSHTRELLRKATVNEVCLECHDQTMTGAHPHRPAAEDCTTCHEAHTSSHAKLLRMPTRDLCTTCHESVTRSISTMAHPHKPAEGDCLTCHSPHSTNAIGGLTQSPKELCLSCHDGVGRTISAASHPHSVTTDERACLNCHSAHASEHAAQLLKDAVSTCLECHDKPIVVSEAKTVPGVPELAAPNMFLHGPVKVGECSACHTVHGGALAALLIEPYPASFYQTYTDEAYALCFKCHDKALMQPNANEKQTGFRDGTRNLHAVHVATGPQGRTCRACHAVHASRFKTLMADTVTFGQWKLPLNYTETPTGGSCASGCHKPMSYDRENPVSSALTAPPSAQEPPPSPPPAPEPEPAR